MTRRPSEKILTAAQVDRMVRCMGPTSSDNAVLGRQRICQRLAESHEAMRRRFDQARAELDELRAQVAELRSVMCEFGLCDCEHGAWAPDRPVVDVPTGGVL